jgi:uncharacterized protein (DUF1697 family)
MTRYVAFLRGINVGRHRRITMAELKRAFEAAGYRNIATYIASGNVIFDGAGTDAAALTQEVEVRLETALGYHVDVILWSAEEVHEMVSIDPFAGVEAADQIRLNVTFLGGEGNGASAPMREAEGFREGFRVVGTSERAVFSVLDLREVGTREVMKVLEKTYGKRITTRSWKVIQEISARYLDP